VSRLKQLSWFLEGAGSPDETKRFGKSRRRSVGDANWGGCAGGVGRGGGGIGEDGAGEVVGAEPASWAGLVSGGGGSTISTSSTSSSSESISRALLGVRRSVGAGARGGGGSAISIKAASAGKEQQWSTTQHPETRRLPLQAAAGDGPRDGRPPAHMEAEEAKPRRCSGVEGLD